MVIVAWYTSPWWADWRIVVASVVLYFLQIWAYGACVLSAFQFSDKQKGFFSHYLMKIGFRKPDGFIRVMSYVIPITIAGIAIIRQVF